MGRTRSANFRSSIYKGADGYWHGRVTVGLRDDGTPDRRHVMRKNKVEVVDKVRKLEQARNAGSTRKAGEHWRVGEWLTHWVNTIAIPPRLTEHIHDGYRVDVEKHLNPGLGAHWLDRLKPEHLERLYAKMLADGLAAGTAHHVHRTARAALNEAVRRGYLARNPVPHAKPPSSSDEEVEPYDVPEIRRLLVAASRGRNSARWAVALAVGGRGPGQGHDSYPA